MCVFSIGGFKGNFESGLDCGLVFIVASTETSAPYGCLSLKTVRLAGVKEGKKHLLKLLQ